MATKHTKMTGAQKLALVEELEKPENRFLVTGSTHPTDIDNAKKKWNEIAVILNSRTGPMKTGDKWKKTFIELRCNINKKARGIIVQRQRGLASTPGPVELTDIEDRIYNLIMNKNYIDELEGFEEFADQSETPEHPEDSSVDIPLPLHGSALDPLQAMPSSSNPIKSPITSPRRSAASWRDRRKVKSVRSVMKNEQARQAVETFASAAQMQADALQQIAAAMQRVANVQEQSSLRLVSVLEKFINSMGSIINK